ncbi:hypothetical protein Lfu02_20550 [Longispora fulva]|uniref:DUF397 domain-containing protein n=1 Tax=Longispora fulva TaxID=619741 RepID=A0A8J7GYG2_9ACTN|nr:DUF397 domain-containing protein [Longispora fulva]MBG6139933.1 hypothetical protein [Longispora fulva]GIG57683.1 hypothetical protein Lfu02_20550 [Longispora fulva]
MNNLRSANWRRGSRSAGTGNCVEVAPFNGLAWRRSSRSADTGNCVEVAVGVGLVGVRDSKLGDESPVLVVSAEDWRGFLAAVRG